MPVLFVAGACEIGLKGMGGAAVASGDAGQTSGRDVVP